MHRRRNVLHFLRADVGELHRQFVGDLLMHRARDADAADFGEALEARRDVDAIAEQIAVAFDHVTDGDADAETHMAARRIGHVAGAQAFLDVDRAAHRFDGAGKLGQHRIARGVENAAAGLGDEFVGDGAIGSEPPQRLLFILANQPAVSGDIGSKNRRYLAFHKAKVRAMICPQNAVRRLQAQPALAAPHALHSLRFLEGRHDRTP
jgi:hypothetical protein